jgi:DNA-binding response OmpR family regulator
VHILVVEDEERLANLLRRVLVEQQHIVDIACSGERGIELGLGSEYDLITLDSMLPDVDGINVLRTLRSEGIGTSVLMLTARDDVSDRVAGLNAGADDYLVKPFAMKEFLARVRALLRRRDEPPVPSQILRVEDLMLDPQRREVRRAGQAIELTATEFSLLEYLMTNAGHVLSRGQILGRVWDSDMEWTSNIVGTYIHYVREKVDRGRGKALITTIRGVGYRIGE